MRATNIGILLYDILKTNIPEVDGRIFPVIAENGCLYPFIAYSRLSLTPVYNKDGIIEESCEVAINILTNNYKEGIELSNKVRDILDQYVDNNIGQSRLKNSSEAYTEFEFLQTLNYEFILK